MTGNILVLILAASTAVLFLCDVYTIVVCHRKNGGSRSRLVDVLQIDAAILMAAGLISGIYLGWEATARFFHCMFGGLAGLRVESWCAESFIAESRHVLICVGCYMCCALVNLIVAKHIQSVQQESRA